MKETLPDYQSSEWENLKEDPIVLDILRASGFKPSERICLLCIHKGIPKKELFNLLKSSKRHARRIYRDTERKVSDRTYMSMSATPPLSSDKNCPKRTYRSVLTLKSAQKLSQTDTYVRFLDTFQYLSERFLAENTRQYYKKSKYSLKEKEKSSGGVYVLSSSSNVLSFKDKNKVLLQQDLIMEEKIMSEKYPYQEIIEDLNKKSGKSFSHKSPATRDLIRVRMNEDYTKEDFFTIHTNQVAEWKGTKWVKYLRPETLYCRKKFEGYLNNISTRNIKTGMAETGADLEGRVPSKDNKLISPKMKKIKEQYE